MDGLVVRLGALHVRERAHRPAEPLLEPELREHDLARASSTARSASGRWLIPCDSTRMPAASSSASSPQSTVALITPRGARRSSCGSGRSSVEVADRHEDDAGIAVALEHRRGVLEVVAVAVVERDQHRPRGSGDAAA